MIDTNMELPAPIGDGRGQSPPWDDAPPGELYETDVSVVVPEIGPWPAAETVDPGASAALNVQVWLERFPLRPNALWATVAALLASGLFLQDIIDWRNIVLLLLLADPLWGSIWRLSGGRKDTLSIRKQVEAQSLWLPYLQSNSPATRLLGWEEESALPLLIRLVMPTILVALAVGWVLGAAALWLTLLMVLVSMLGWITRQTWQRTPLILQSVATIALPWALVLAVNGSPLQEVAAGEGDAVAGVMLVHELLLLALWTLHHWGELRSLSHPGDRSGLIGLAAADIGVALLLVWLQIPLWLMLLSIVWLPTWLLLYRRLPLGRARFWWLAAMLLSGLALGTS